MANEKNLNIDEFLYSIDKMLESKYILIDRRISDILLAIADTKEVYNLIAECMINFDFAYEWKKSTQGAYLKFPESDARRISYIFCLLNNIDDRNLDITQILEKYFSYDRAHTPYELFCKHVIVEFRRLILEGLNVKNQDYYLDEGTKYSNDVMPKMVSDYDILQSKIRNVITDLKMMKKLKKCCMQKADVIAVLSTFEQIVQRKQTEYFYAFLVTIKTALGEIKEFKKELTEICDLIEKLILRG